MTAPVAGRRRDLAWGARKRTLRLVGRPLRRGLPVPMPGDTRCLGREYRGLGDGGEPRVPPAADLLGDQS